MKTKNKVVPRFVRRDGSRTDYLTLVKIESGSPVVHYPSVVSGEREVAFTPRISGGFAVAVSKLEGQPKHDGTTTISTLDGYRITGKFSWRRAKKAPKTVIDQLSEWDTYDSLEPIKEPKPARGRKRSAKKVPRKEKKARKG